MLEYARHVCGFKKVGHPELDHTPSMPLLDLTVCSVDSRPTGTPRLWGGLKINLVPATRAWSIYQSPVIQHTFRCSYELNSAYRPALEQAGLKISGIGADGSVRITELPDRPFFLGTGFVPQLSSLENRPHPLITAFVQEASL